MHHATHQTLRIVRRVTVVLLCCACVIVATSAGCSRKVEKKKPISRYPTQPEKPVAPVLADTIFHRTDVGSTDPYLVSGYGLIANLDNTGGSEAPTPVRDFMIKQMQQHYVGSALQPGWENVTPSQILADKRFALVRVDGYMPPGIREGEFFDINVAALPESSTSSLARGDLWRTDLRSNGTDARNLGGPINVWARAQGPLFVNPEYALEKSTATDATAKRSLRRGIVMDGGVSLVSRPITLILRQPQRSMARRIEMRVDEYFQNSGVAAAQDEGVVYLYVPAKYNGDWQHFVGLVTHLYLRDSEGFNASKAKLLAEEAVKPKAPLADISYCWEGLGHFGLPYYRDLMGHADSAVAFYAARAAAFVGDPIAPEALARIAKTKGDQFQVAAVRTLGALPNSPSINQTIRPLLDSEQALVRVEAYRVLAEHKDPSIFTRVIAPAGQPNNEKFVLDIVKSSGPPIIHATRSGIPRIAIIGDRAQIHLPLVFAAMDGRLTISSEAQNPKYLTIYYRPTGGATPDARVAPPSKVLSTPDLAELVSRLGGEGGGGLNFNYGDVVSILSALTDDKKLVAYAGGARVPAQFVLQEMPNVENQFLDAPAIPDARPQADEPGKVGMAK
jgi:hypothetical protein